MIQLGFLPAYHTEKCRLWIWAGPCCFICVINGKPIFRPMNRPNSLRARCNKWQLSIVTMASLLSPYRFILSLPQSTPSSIKIGLAHLPLRLRVTTPALARRRYNTMSQPTSESAPAAEDGLDPQTTDSAAEVLVQYVVLRRDLIDTWPMGSVVTQGCHASVAAIWSHKDDPHTLQYCSPQNIDSMHKVTLEVKGEPQILNLSEKLKAGGIAHKLWVEQPENLPTCLATKPYPKSTVAPFFKKLKLCK